EQGGGIYIGSIESPDIKRLLTADTPGRYSPPGELLFVRQSTLFAQLFDSKTLQLSGEPVRIAESIPTDFGFPAFSVSNDGRVLVYRTGIVAKNNLQLAWLDRTGKLIQPVGAPGGYAGPEVSPDGKRIAVHRHDNGGGDIWVFESAN